MLNGAVGAVVACYPFLVYASRDHVQPRHLALLLAAVFLLRAARARRSRAGGPWAALASACVLFMLAAGLSNEPGMLLAYPVFVSLLFLCVFAHSLARPPTVVERLARLQDPRLPPRGVAYTRKVTLAWCVFFIANASLSAGTAWHGDPWVWSLYNGVVSYALMGMLMAGEMLVRRKVRKTF